jgi:hypothetical protein
MKSLAIANFVFWGRSPRNLGFCGRFPAIGHTNVVVPNRSASAGTAQGDPDSMGCSAVADAASRAADQLPQTVVTMLAEGQFQSVNRRCASLPHAGGRAFETSRMTTAAPYRACHSRIAASTSSRVQRRSIAPGWQRLQ